MSQDKSENMISETIFSFFKGIKKGQEGPDSYHHSVSVKKEIDWIDKNKDFNWALVTGCAVEGLRIGGTDGACVGAISLAITGGILSTGGGPAVVLGLISGAALGALGGALAGAAIGCALGFIAGVISELIRLSNITPELSATETPSL